MSHVIFDSASLVVDSFSGGKERGRCLQFNTEPGECAQLDRPEVERLSVEIGKWLAETAGNTSPSAEAP